MARAPLPTAAATGFTEPERMSPIANTPGMLVSNGQLAPSALSPVNTKPLPIEGDTGPSKPIRVRISAGMSGRKFHESRPNGIVEKITGRRAHTFKPEPAS